MAWLARGQVSSRQLTCSLERQDPQSRAHLRVQNARPLLPSSSVGDEAVTRRGTARLAQQQAAFPGARVPPEEPSSVLTLTQATWGAI